MQPFCYFNVSVWSDEIKSCLLGMCQNSVLAPYCKEWGPRYPINTSKRLQFLWMPFRYLQTTPRHPPDTPKASPGNATCQQTPKDTARHPRTLTSADWLSRAVSDSVGDFWVISHLKTPANGHAVVFLTDLYIWAPPNIMSKGTFLDIRFELDYIAES